MHATFTGLLKGYFDRAHLSYSKVADLCWVDVAYLYRLANGGKSRPTRDVVIRLAIGLRLDVGETDELLMAAGHAPLLQIVLRRGRSVERAEYSSERPLGASSRPDPDRPLSDDERSCYSSAPRETEVVRR